MMTYTQSQLEKLKAGPVVSYLIRFNIGNTTYRLTSQDKSVSYNSETYSPGFNLKVGGIEITSTPKTNDISISLVDVNASLVTELLSGNWINKDCAIFKLFQDQQGDTILVKSAFEGSLTGFEIDEESSTIDLTVTSVWADFEKASGIKTNLKSQQRYYPNDTAGRHSSEAIKKIYWGKDAPKSEVSIYSNGGIRSGFTEPEARRIP